MKYCKKILVIILMSIFLLMGMLETVVNASTLENRYLGIFSHLEKNGETIGYGINIPGWGGKVIVNILEYDSANSEEAKILEKQPALYCLKAGVGFENEGEIVTYDIAYDMIREREKISKQNEISYQLVYRGNYDKLLTLLDLMYIPETSTNEYRTELLKAAMEKYPVEYNYPITDNDIAAVNQALIWHYTNEEDTRFHNYDEEDWLTYTRDGIEYDCLANYEPETQEGKDRSKQAEALYKYLIDETEAQMPSEEQTYEPETCKICTAEPGSQVNTREQPDASSNLVEVLNDQTIVTRTEKRVAYNSGYVWDKIQLEDGREAYIASQYLDTDTNQTMYKVATIDPTDSVNVRKETNTYADIVTVLPNGYVVNKIEKRVEYSDGYIWDKIQLTDGTEGYVATQFLNEYQNKTKEEEIIKKHSQPITIKQESNLEYEIKDSNYIVGPIDITKNNDTPCNIDLTLKNGEEEIQNYTLLDSEKNETSKEKLAEGGTFYISIPKKGIEKILIDFNMNYDSKEMNLLASTQNDEEQIVVDVETTKKQETKELEVKLKKFDLSLYKWVSEIIVVEDGVQKVTPTGYTPYDNPKSIAKVDINRKKLSTTKVKFKFSMRITNEGEIAGYAKNIKDYIPAGLTMLEEENPEWKWENKEENIVSTRTLESKLLQPGEYADIDIILTWNNSEQNLGVKKNFAEISEDGNDMEVSDSDSVIDNQNEKEDDMDYAEVILSIATGNIEIYYVLGGTALVMMAVGIFLIKKYVIG